MSQLFVPLLVCLIAPSFAVPLSEIVESLLTANQPVNSYWQPKADGADRFAVEINAPDWNQVQSIAHAAGFVVEGRLQSFKNIYVASKQSRHKRDTAAVVRELISLKEVQWAEHLVPFYREKRTLSFSDPLYEHQLRSWSSPPNMFVSEAWSEGLTGRGVTLAVLDDGVEEGHDDLQAALDKEISHNFVSAKDRSIEESHGTRCAGIIAMAANNSKCGVGVAHQARLGALTVLAEDQLLNDAIEGDALAFKSDQIDIYSVSWGPKDDGRSAERPGSLAQKALEFGAAHGRKGLGSLYVWASGNGGLEEDDCAMDGYASNMHTLTFGVASSSGIPPWYAEGCSAVIAAISEGSPTENGMVTTDIGNKCASFAGSSAAAPFGAAILALTLEAKYTKTIADNWYAHIWKEVSRFLATALVVLLFYCALFDCIGLSRVQWFNYPSLSPSLTQRDVQHLIVHTSDSEHLRISSPSYWLVNGAGLPFSRHFGFGVLNALRLTRAARSWKTVPALTTCSRQLTVLNGTFSAGSSLSVELPFEGCSGTSGEVNWIERLQLEVSIEHPQRGLISLLLTSPAGTTIQLLHPRKNDDSSDGLSRWPFISVAQWGENPRGTWRIEAYSMGYKRIRAVGLLTTVTLTVQGTRDDPLKENAFILQR